MSARTSSEPGATGNPAFSEIMLCEAKSAFRARLLVATALTAWGLPRLVDPAVLITSELVSNTVSHTSCHLLQVIVSRVEPMRVRVAVVDESRSEPTLGTASLAAESGRGLALLDALADRWGTDFLRSGKRVWAECADSGQTAGTPSPEHAP